MRATCMVLVSGVTLGSNKTIVTRRRKNNVNAIQDPRSVSRAIRIGFVIGTLNLARVLGIKLNADRIAIEIRDQHLSGRAQADAIVFAISPIALSLNSLIWSM